MNANRSKHVLFVIVFVLASTLTLHAQTASSSASYSFVDRGDASFASLGQSSALTVGYGLVQPGGGTTTPAGVAIFDYRTNGVLVTEAGVPAMQPLASGRTYAEVNGPINTGIAIANPNSFPVTISFYFTNSTTATDFGQNSFTIAAGAQMAAFLNQSPFNANVSFAGSFTFSATAPIGIISLRGFTNERGDFLITTQAVASLSGSSSGPVVMAHFADGGGWTTSVLLVNTSDQAMTGTVQFYSEGNGSVAATPITLTVDGQLSASFTYSIPSHSSVRLATSGLASSTSVGSVVVTPASGSGSPSGHTLFSFVSNGVTVTQATVLAQPAGTAFRMYVETAGVSGQVGSIQSGIAITNTATSSTSVTVELIAQNGVSTGLTANLTIAGSGHISKFLDELFPSVSGSFKGMVRISSVSSPLVVVGLRTRYNERGDFLITTTPASNENASMTTSAAIFPHIVDGGGYTTQFVLFSGISGQSGTGAVQFFTQTGQALTLTYQ